MSEKRRIRTYEQGTGKLISEETYELSAEELAEEQEVEQIRQIEAILEQDWTATQAQQILKRLIKRLLKKGYLP